MNHEAIKKPSITCFKCLKEFDTLIYIFIPSMGYGSGFDEWKTHINLCEDCYQQTNSEWWKLEVVPCDFDPEFAQYKYEDQIFEFVDSLPVEGMELFYNRYASDKDMEPQDWIDYRLGVLPHEKCKKYGLWSRQEIDAYHERFPICQHPVNRIFEDNSKGCWCPFGAHGDYEQKCSINISGRCHQCSNFEKRTTPIKDILDKDYDDYRIYYVSTINAEKYKQKFE